MDVKSIYGRVRTLDFSLRLFVSCMDNKKMKLET